MSLPLLSSGAQCRHASTEWPGLDWFWWQNAWGHKLELHGLAGIHPSIRPSIHPTFLLHSCFRNSMKQFSCQSFCFPMKYNDIAGLLARRGEAVAAKSCSRPGNSVPHECVQKSYIYIYIHCAVQRFFFERLPQEKLRRTGAFVTYQFRCRLVTPTILDVSDLASSINLSFRARRMVFISSSIASILPPEWFCLGHHVASVRLPATCSCSRITSTRKWALQISLRCHWANNCRCSRELQSGLPKQHTTRLSLHEHTHGSDALCTSCDFTYEFFRVWWCHITLAGLLVCCQSFEWTSPQIIYAIIT